MNDENFRATKRSKKLKHCMKPSTDCEYRDLEENGFCHFRGTCKWKEGFGEE